MKKNFKTYGFVALLVSVSVGLSGCSRKLYEEGHLTQNRVQVEQQKFSDQMPVSDFNENFAAGLGQYYRNHGEGTVEFSVLYDPRSSVNNAMNASQEASRIASLMRSKGILDVEANILPINDLGSEANVLINFMSYSASAPKDCDTMPGFADANIGFQEDYKLGCTVDTVFARQIARPKDLAGNANAGDTTDGRRASNIVDIYRSGAPNQPLNGQTASGE